MWLGKHSTSGWSISWALEEWWSLSNYKGEGQHQYQDNRVGMLLSLNLHPSYRLSLHWSRHFVNLFIVFYLHVLGIAELVNILFTFPQQNKECISQPIMEKAATHKAVLDNDTWTEGTHIPSRLRLHEILGSSACLLLIYTMHKGCTFVDAGKGGDWTVGLQSNVMMHENWAINSHFDRTYYNAATDSKMSLADHANISRYQFTLAGED